MSEQIIKFNTLQKMVAEVLFCLNKVHFMSKRKVRVIWRFQKVFSITSICSIKYFLTTCFKGYQFQNFELHTKCWAKQLLSELGIIVNIEGNIPENGCLLIANHRSYIDIPVLFSILPGVFLAKKEVSKWPIFGFATRLAGTIFVKRDNSNSRRESREEIIKRLSLGNRVYVFPEGTTSCGPKLLDFKKGIFDVAAKNYINIVPVAIQYSDKNDAWVGDDTFIAHFFRTFVKKNIYVKIKFCDPVQNNNPEILKKEVYESIYNNLPDFSEVICDLENPT